MDGNPVTCGNCGTENEPGADECVECGLPLTRSADEAIMAAEEAQAQDSVLTSPVPGQPGVENTYVPGTDTTVKDGVPTD